MLAAKRPVLADLNPDRMWAAQAARTRRFVLAQLIATPLFETGATPTAVFS